MLFWFLEISQAQDTVPTELYPEGENDISLGIQGTW